MEELDVENSMPTLDDKFTDNFCFGLFDFKDNDFHENRPKYCNDPAMMKKLKKTLAIKLKKWVTSASKEKVKEYKS